MPRLKDRNRQIPNGLRFYQKETNWKAPLHLSFSSLVAAVISHRAGNPSLSHLPTDVSTVEKEVDQFNAILCQRMGWTEYVFHDGAAEVKKKQIPPSVNVAAEVAPVKTIARGAVTLASILGPSEKPVSSELAEKRAAICAACPQNDIKSDWRSFFSESGAMAVRKLFGFVHDVNLKTSQDEKLGICQACFCPLKMKVWVELDFIVKSTDAETMQRFVPNCWVRMRDK